MLACARLNSGEIQLVTTCLSVKDCAAGIVSLGALPALYLAYILSTSK